MEKENHLLGGGTESKESDLLLNPGCSLAAGKTKTLQMLFIGIKPHVSQFTTGPLTATRRFNGPQATSSRGPGRRLTPSEGVVRMTQGRSAQQELRHSLESAGYDITNC